MVFLAVLFKKTESEHLPMQNFPGKAFPGNYPLENFYPPSPGAKHNGSLAAHSTTLRPNASKF